MHGKCAFCFVVPWFWTNKYLYSSPSIHPSRPCWHHGPSFFEALLLTPGKRHIITKNSKSLGKKLRCQRGFPMWKPCNEEVDLWTSPFFSRNFVVCLEDKPNTKPGELVKMQVHTRNHAVLPSSKLSVNIHISQLVYIYINKCFCTVHIYIHITLMK